MSEPSKFYMWGERGLIATFFADLHTAQNPEAWGEFLNAIAIDAPNFPRKAETVVSVIEPDFANKGFGHPDAVLRVGTGNAPCVVTMEAKRTHFAKACKPRTLRGSRGYNSSLNGQLELDYVLALALERFHLDSTQLTEVRHGTGKG